MSPCRIEAWNDAIIDDHDLLVHKADAKRDPDELRQEQDKPAGCLLPTALTTEDIIVSEESNLVPLGACKYTLSMSPISII